MSCKIIASKGYSKWIKSKECNGCGSGWNAKLVPDSIYGLNIKDCCCPHDYDYETGQSIEDKKAADRRFKNNMFRKIEADDNIFRDNIFVKSLMYRRAKTYFKFVKEFGASAFWENKDTGEEKIAV